MSNRISIEKKYGKFIFTEPDGTVVNAVDVERLLETVESRLDNYCYNPTVSVTTYASDEKSIQDAMDLTMLAALSCWGRELYCGDCIKITITAEHCAENK